MPATYDQIREYVLIHYGYTPGNNCIAEAKERAGMLVQQAHNRIDPHKRVTDCPQNVIQHIHTALRHYGDIP